MQLRSGRCLVYLPLAQQGDCHLCQPHHSSEDRINSLPEDLLLEILTCLRSPAEVARAGAVSRGWRGLWTKLPELTFSYVHPLSVESALAVITRPSLDLLDITLYADWTDEEDWPRQYDPLDAEWSIAQVLAYLPVTDFSVLELDLGTKEHTFGPMMLHLLQIQPTIQRLDVVLARNKVVPCLINCPCEQPSNRRSENVSLANLEVVEIHGLQGEDDEVDFLKLILRCATVL
ncbi:uncharacterized protein [Miscanthus floridulus]|uniref:uncharacterized protein n=1 Tax=Miscanthus floridulus TaxID=154761 RepID=UPI0034587CC1